MEIVLDTSIGNSIQYQIKHEPPLETDRIKVEPNIVADVPTRN